MILLSLVLCVMSGACVTPDLYKKPVKTTFPMNKPSFDEEVSSFLITNDQQQLVIIGKEHHYIFPIYNDLRETLMWSGRSKIMASNLRFVISKDNKINKLDNLKTYVRKYCDNQETIIVMINSGDRLTNPYSLLLLNR